MMNLFDAAQFDTINFVIAREDIEAGRTEPYLERLKQFSARQTLRQMYSKVVISVHGYDNDPRELWEIPEVRRWFMLLNFAYPYWFYFLEKTDSSLLVVTSCICPSFKTKDGQISVEPGALANFLDIHLRYMKVVCKTAGFSETETDEKVDSVLAYFAAGEE